MNLNPILARQTVLVAFWSSAALLSAPAADVTVESPSGGHVMPGTLVENHYLLQNLSAPCALNDTSWIKPGKVWRSSLTTAAAKAIIDYAAANNYQYVHYDAGWYGPERDANSNPLTVRVCAQRIARPGA